MIFPQASIIRSDQASLPLEKDTETLCEKAIVGFNDPNLQLFETLDSYKNRKRLP